MHKLSDSSIIGKIEDRDIILILQGPEKRARHAGGSVSTS